MSVHIEQLLKEARDKLVLFVKQYATEIESLDETSKQAFFETHHLELDQIAKDWIGLKAQPDEFINTASLAFFQNDSLEYDTLLAREKARSIYEFIKEFAQQKSSAQQ